MERRLARLALRYYHGCRLQDAVAERNAHATRTTVEDQLQPGRRDGPGAKGPRPRFHAEGVGLLPVVDQQVPGRPDRAVRPAEVAVAAFPRVPKTADAGGENPRPGQLYFFQGHARSAEADAHFGITAQKIDFQPIQGPAVRPAGQRSPRSVPPNRNPGRELQVIRRRQGGGPLKQQGRGRKTSQSEEVLSLHGSKCNQLVKKNIPLGMLSDIFDGIIARHLKVADDRLRKWDAQRAPDEPITKVN